MPLNSETLSSLQLIRSSAANVLQTHLVDRRRKRLLSWMHGLLSDVSPIFREHATLTLISQEFVTAPDRLARDLVVQSRYLSWVELTDALIEHQHAELHGLGRFVFRDSYNGSIAYTAPADMLKGDVPWMSDVRSDEWEYAVRTVFLALESTGLVERVAQRTFRANLRAVLEAGEPFKARSQALESSDEFFLAEAAGVLRHLLPAVGTTIQRPRQRRSTNVDSFKAAIALAIYQAHVISFATVLRTQGEFNVPLIGRFIVKQGAACFEAHPAFIGMIASNQPQYA